MMRVIAGRVALALLVCVLGMSHRVRALQQTALDRYVAAPDPSYSFHEVGVGEQEGCRVHVLDMTSQTWLTKREVDHPVWKHWLIIAVPPKVKTSTGLLFITGGSIGRPAPRAADGTLAKIAAVTGSVVAELHGVPNEPLVFSDDGKQRTEDGIIAYTWDKFLRTGDARWPLRLPMTKSAVRAMDTITSFCAGESGGMVSVGSFFVAGASKRGWTTWTTAAVDKRVIAFSPIVIDTLNLQGHSQRQLAAYGFYSDAVRDYIDIGLPNWDGTRAMRDLMRIEDPYTYRDRYTMPKLMINATGDQYFLPDNSQFYFSDLPGAKYLRYVPNADHSLEGSDARQTLLSFYASILAGKPLPRFTWTLERDGGIRVQAPDRPEAVRLWHAENPRARDFRLETIGQGWTSSTLSEQPGGVYVAKVPTPKVGWAAFMVELTFPNPGLPPLKFTTQVRVEPDTLPFADKVRRAPRAAIDQRPVDRE